MKLLYQSQFRYLLQHRFQTFLTILGIALGVAVVHAVDITNYSAKANLKNNAQQLSGLANYRVTASEPISETLYAELRAALLSKHPDLQITPLLQSTLWTEKKLSR